MTAETIQRLEAEIRTAYPGGTSTTDGDRRLILLPEVHFPAGCKPEAGVALVVLDPNAPKPDLYLGEVPALPSGNRVSVGTVAVAGQTWQTFSFNLNWDEEAHTGLQFLHSSTLGREFHILRCAALKSGTPLAHSCFETD